MNLKRVCDAIIDENSNIWRTRRLDQECDMKEREKEKMMKLRDP